MACTLGRSEAGHALLVVPEPASSVIPMLAPTRGPGVGDRAVRIERFTASIRY